MNLDAAIGRYAGPCACCGRSDTRHRLFDSVRDAHRAGLSVAEIADDFNLTVEGVEWVIAQRRFVGVRRRRA